MSKSLIISLLAFSLQVNAQSSRQLQQTFDSTVKLIKGNLLLPGKNCSIIMGYGRQETGPCVIQNPGITFKFENKCNIQAAWAGIVCRTVVIDSMNVVIIDCGGIFIAYSNIDKLIVKKGQHIKKGDFIGIVGKNFDDDDYVADVLISNFKGGLDPTEWFDWSKTKPGR